MSLKAQSKISLCMVVRNEELLIAKAINSVRSIVNEIVVLDTGSNDNTCKIASSLGGKVIKKKWDNNFGSMRNISIEEARGDWILILDADESIAKSQLKPLVRLTLNKKVSGYYFPVRNYTREYDLLCDWHANDGSFPKEELFSRCPGWSLTKALRLFRKESFMGYDEAYSPHESLIPTNLSRKNNIIDSAVFIHHFHFLKGSRFVLAKQRRYLATQLNGPGLKQNTPLAYCNIAKTLFTLHQDESALEYLKKGINRFPRYFDLYLLLGIVYKERNMYRESEQALKKAISLNSKSAEARIALGMIYDLQGNPLKAEKILKEAIRLKPKHPLAHNSLGLVYQGLDKFNKAKAEFIKAIKINPYCRDFIANLSDLPYEPSV
jgi:glycosyltransferase involved in cell wall biosynthesis